LPGRVGGDGGDVVNALEPHLQVTLSDECNKARSSRASGARRRDQTLAVLEGFHALKHALRFGANVLEVVCGDRDELDRLATALAPDVSAQMLALAAAGRARSPRAARSAHALGRRDRPSRSVRPSIPPPCWPTSLPSPVVLLEDPRDLGNMAPAFVSPPPRHRRPCSRLAATTPGTPDALRGGRRLHYAVAVLPDGASSRRWSRWTVLCSRSIRAGSGLRLRELPARALLAFGHRSATASATS